MTFNNLQTLNDNSIMHDKFAEIKSLACRNNGKRYCNCFYRYQEIIMKFLPKKIGNLITVNVINFA